jgi:hypothetical protein
MTQKGLFCAGRMVLTRLRFGGDGTRLVPVERGGTYQYSDECQTHACVGVEWAGDEDEALLFLGWTH